MPKRKKPEIDPKEQFKRFQETAKEHGVDESGRDIDTAFERLASKVHPKISASLSRKSATSKK
jgi:hypothetical protein